MKVAIIMGSDSDLPIMQEAVSGFKRFWNPRRGRHRFCA